MQFADLRLIEPILRALSTEGYTTATPIQAQAIPLILANRDVIGCAQTGTGKTAAFAAPILQRLSQPGSRSGGKAPRCLVLCPTRKLAIQIADGFRSYGKNLQLRHAVIFGGVGQGPQVDALRRGLDVLIATPGRLLDLMEQGFVDFKSIEVLVLDEADRMLDMGFIRDIRKIVHKLPGQRQTLLFSATMPPEIRQLADSMMRKPAHVQVASVSQEADSIDQSVYFVAKANKSELLAHLVNELPMSRAIVFTRTKHGADRVVRHLHQRGIRAEAIHGNKSQNARQRALENFRAGKIPVLIATDIASRGIDIDDISHVVNYDLTHEPEVYVHRIGRTARAGASGAAVSFCDKEEVVNLKAIERLVRHSIPVKNDQPVYSKAPAHATRPAHGDHEERYASHGTRPARPVRSHPVSDARKAHARHQSSVPQAQTRRHQPTASTRPVGKGAGHPLVHKGQPRRGGGGRRRGF